MGKIKNRFILFPEWLIESISFNWSQIPDPQPLESQSVGSIFRHNEFRGYNE